MLRQALRFAITTFLFCAAVEAQNIAGTILGTVRDSSAATVAGATVVATNVETNQPTQTVTNNSGYYELPYLKPGIYAVRVSGVGFKSAERKNLELSVDDRTRVDFTLEVGDMSTSISINETIAPIQSESASLGSVVTGKVIQDMPAAGRNVFEMAGLVAGVMVNPTAEGRTVNEGGFDSSDISIGGGRYRTNEYLIDGITVMLPQNNNHAITPTPEATQELKVMTGNNGSEFGRTGGGTINVITRGGTNEFHGNAWEFFRNDSLLANDFFANLRGQDKGIYTYHIFGATFGGPIRRNKTFFFAEYQATRNHSDGGSGAFTFPTAAERSGDFSATKTSSGIAVTIYDPLTTVNNAGTYTRTAFTGNRIPANRIDPTAAKLLQYIPLPNSEGIGPAHLNNFTYKNGNDVNSDQGSMRIDHRFSDKHSIFGRITRAVTRIDSPAVLGTIADSGGDNQIQAELNGVINGTFIISANKLINYRTGMTRKIQNTHPTYLDQIKLSELGFAPSVANHAQMQLFPMLSFNGYDSVGTAPPRRVSNDIYASAADYTQIHGRHTFKTGVDFRIYNQNPFNASSAGGAYSFANDFTQGPNPLRTAIGSGNAIASFLTGYGNGSIQYTPAFAIRNAYVGIYGSDDIRLGRLTLNLGLRWEFEQPRTERYDRFANFDWNARFPITVSGMPNLTGVLTHAGQNEVPRGQFEPASHNFAPQVGLAYRLHKTTAIRAAFGIVYAPRIGYPNSRNFGASGEEVATTWVSSLDGVTPLYPMSNLFPNGIFGQSNNPADRLLLGQALTITDRNSRNNAYMEQWNFSIQQALAGNWTLEAAYVGSHGIHLPLAVQFNQLNPIYMSMKTGLNKQVTNPFFGLVSTGTLSTPTVTQAQLLRPYPQYLNISTFIQSEAFSTYNSINLTAQKRFSHGFSAIVAYSMGKTIDNGAGRVLNITGLQPPVQNAYDLNAERSLSQQDVSQRLVFSHTVELPFGKGRRHLSNAPRLVDGIAGGWSVSGQATFQTGYPLWLSSSGNSGVFSAVLRPNNNGHSAALSGDVESRLYRFFDTSVFSVPDPFTFGNTGRALPDVRGPGRRNYNLALSKSFPITERFKAMLRGEAYNLTNTPYFAFPGSKLGSNDFGIISSSTGARQIQLSVKVQW
jgi:hypothetical protein